MNRIRLKVSKWANERSDWCQSVPSEKKDKFIQWLFQRITFRRLVSSKAFRRLGIARPATHKLQFAGCISIIIMKLETVTSPAADKECPFPGSGQCYHGIRQKTRFQAGWADRFEGMRTVAALKSPIQSSVAMMAKGYYVSVPVGPSSLTLSMVERTRTGAWWTVRYQFTTPEMWVSSGHECRSIQFQTLNNIVQLPNIRDLLLSPFFFNERSLQFHREKLIAMAGQGPESAGCEKTVWGPTVYS